MKGFFERLILRLPFEPGRQQADYKKFCLFSSKRLSADCYLLYYPSGTELPWHDDKVPGRQHWRVNVTLVKPRAGGELRLLQWWNQKLKRRFGRFTLFCSDYTHMVTKCDGWRLVLSFGCAALRE